ncbi:unnamed protein product, partial [Mesorhabditis spiculigera]
MPSRNNPLVVVIGCTGTGKSDLGVAIAKKFNGEVISCDSLQIYKGMDIATNKITPEEAQGVAHHCMSFVDPVSSSSFTSPQFTVHDFREMAVNKINELHKCGKLVGRPTTPKPFYLKTI